MGENKDHTRRRKSQNKWETTMNILKGKRSYCSNETTAKSLKQINILRMWIFQKADKRQRRKKRKIGQNTPQTDLQLLFNLYENSNSLFFFLQKQEANSKIHMEVQGTQRAKQSWKKNSWRTCKSWFQNLI